MELMGRRFGHIRVTEVVGQGGMGDVYAGFDEKLERKVALKVLNADQRLDEEARERLLREARALSRLDHPNICRIHDYIESGDVDLLVLEYIDGRTLHDALNERMTHGEKLRIASAIAEVLVQAHRAGIVHRDLKPENVMLTKAGEVKVLDFGLARWLQRARQSSGKTAVLKIGVRQEEATAIAETMALPQFSDAFGSTPAGRREFLATAVGITLGTPLYMSPEQARGESLTPASDMFSFGLLLQRLFTGKEPHPEDLTAREVILRVARGTTEPVEGAPRDVTALLGRLKQFAPADRPTAVEALERLKFLHVKPQRIARQAIVAALAVIALLGAWRYTVDLRAERAIAVAARAEADRRRAQAEGLLEFMLGDLRQKLEPVGQLDILDDVAERALAYTGSAKPETLSTAELIQHAKALHQLTQVRISQGKLNAAFDTSNRALLLTAEAAKRKDASDDVQFALATSHFWIGNVGRLRGEYQEALAQLQKYRDVTVKLAAANPANDTYQVERAYGHSAVATILETQGDFQGALAEYEPALAVSRARLEADRGDVQKQADLAFALNKLGYALQSVGRLSDAQRHFEEEHALYASLVRSDPRQRQWQSRLANSHSYLAALLELTGDDDQAMMHRTAQAELYQRLHGHDPTNAGWKRNYAISLMRVGELERRGSAVQTALPLFVRAEKLLAEVIASDPTRPTWRLDLAFVQTAHARALLASGRSGDAGALVRTAESSLLQLSAGDPVVRRSLADSRIVMGESYAAAGNMPQADAAWARALATIEELGRRTTDPLILDTWARALLLAGRGAEAQPVLERLHRAGYRHTDLETLVARVQSGRREQRRETA
ncbi:MAG TPA: serine/threonine-protein kinase [Thermoanaerobaculia bacterium]|nr:serine/threonine-protein kinase [Thermoanaerobaculia bacterium]